MKKLIILISIVFLSCHYQKDKLKVFNKSSIDIHYLPMVYDLDRNYYLALSVGSNIRQGEHNSPYLRGTISECLKQKEFDGFLYIVYFEEKYFKYASENEKKIIYDKRFKVQKYPLKQLDSLNWTITYDGN